MFVFTKTTKQAVGIRSHSGLNNNTTLQMAVLKHVAGPTALLLYPKSYKLIQKHGKV